MKIRVLHLEDLEQMLQLCAQLGYPSTMEELTHRFHEFFKSDQHAVFVADEADKIVGFIQVNRESVTLVAGPRAEISALVVDEKYRGKKVGSQLIEVAENWCRNQNLPLIRIRSNIKRETAHKFYQNRGYKIEKSWHLFTKKI
jgi:GNAT superfamily N-acetyltransferase